MTIIARKPMTALLGTVAAGIACICVGVFSVWEFQPFSWWTLLFSAWFCFGGLVMTVGGWMDWHPQGVDLVFDKQGLWFKLGKFRFLPWDDIAGVQLVQWNDEGDTEHGLLIGLREDAQGPLDPLWLNCLANDLTRMLGPLPWPRVIMLHHEAWQWSPPEVLADIEASLTDPAVRERW